jgi:hypothetical protein
MDEKTERFNQKENESYMGTWDKEWHDRRMVEREAKSGCATPSFRRNYETINWER